MEMFNPNQPNDFASQTAAIDAQKQLAEYLRKKALKSSPPKGQMVDGIYVRPNMLEGLTHVLDQYQAGQAERGISEKQQGLAQAAALARQKWQQEAPQATPAVPEQAGPIDPNNPTELAARPALPLTTQQINQYASRGAEIPGNDKQALLAQSSMYKDLEREDKQSELRQTLAARANEAREKLVKELEFKREQLAETARQHENTLKIAGGNNATSLQIASMVSASKAASDAIALQIAALKKGQDSSKEQKILDDDTEKLSRRAEPLVQVISPANQIQGILDSAYDPKTKKYSKIPGFQVEDRLKPLFTMSHEAATNYGAQQSLGNALLKAGAGLSQTLSEKENQLVEQMRKGTATQDQFIDVWPGLMNKLNNQIGATRAGYNPKVQETFDKRFQDAGGSVAFKPITSKHASGKPAGMSDADWAELQQLRGEVGTNK